MKFRTLGRHLREGIRNVSRNGWMTVASIVSVSIALLILGTMLIVAFNINQITHNLESEAEIRVLLDMEVSEEEAAEMGQVIQQLPEVERVQLITSEEAFDQLIASMGEEGRHFEEFKGEEVLPHTLVVETTNPQDVHQVAETVRKMEGVHKANDGGETTKALFNATQTVRNVGLVFILGLAFTAMLLIANTIRMTITVRRPEIEIMKLVGATNAFVRWPFFVEGVVLGVIGAIIPIILLALGYRQVLERVYETLQLPFLELLPLVPLIYQVGLILIAIGAFIGMWGSLISVRRFLKV